MSEEIDPEEVLPGYATAYGVYRSEVLGEWLRCNFRERERDEEGEDIEYCEVCEGDWYPAAHKAWCPIHQIICLAAQGRTVAP